MGDDKKSTIEIPPNTLKILIKGKLWNLLTDYGKLGRFQPIFIPFHIICNLVFLFFIIH